MVGGGRVVGVGGNVVVGEGAVVVVGGAAGPGTVDPGVALAVVVVAPPGGSVEIEGPAAFGLVVVVAPPEEAGALVVVEKGTRLPCRTRPEKLDTLWKGSTGIGLVARLMKCWNIWAGKVPPVTLMPRTEVMGLESPEG